MTNNFDDLAEQSRILAETFARLNGESSGVVSGSRLISDQFRSASRTIDQSEAAMKKSFKELENSLKGLTKTTFDLATQMARGKEQMDLNQAGKVLTGSVRATTDGLSTVAQHLGKFGPAASLFIKAFGRVTEFLGGEAIAQMQKSLDLFRDATKSGAVLAFKDLTEGAQKTGLLFNEYSRVLKSQGDALSNFGATALDGRKKFESMVEASGEATDQMRKFGNTTEEIRILQLGVAKHLSKMGMSFGQVAATSNEYMLNLEALSKITQKDKTKLLQEREEMAKDALLRVRAKQGKTSLSFEQIEEARGQLSPAQYKLLRDSLLGKGAATTEAVVGAKRAGVDTAALGRVTSAEEAINLARGASVKAGEYAGRVTNIGTTSESLAKLIDPELLVEGLEDKSKQKAVSTAEMRRRMAAGPTGVESALAAEQISRLAQMEIERKAMELATGAADGVTSAFKRLSDLVNGMVENLSSLGSALSTFAIAISTGLGILGKAGIPIPGGGGGRTPPTPTGGGGTPSTPTGGGRTSPTPTGGGGTPSTPTGGSGASWGSRAASAAKTAVKGSVAGGVVSGAITAAETGDWKRGAVDAAFTTGGSILGGVGGSFLMPGIGTMAGGVAGGMAGSAIGNKVYNWATGGPSTGSNAQSATSSTPSQTQPPKPSQPSSTSSAIVAAAESKPVSAQSAGGTMNPMTKGFTSNIGDKSALAANIAAYESGKLGYGGTGYNAFNRGTANNRIIPGDNLTDFSKMTIAEFLRRGNLPPGNPDKVFAMGKYQIIPPTMRDLAAQMKLPMDTLLTPENQDAMFSFGLVKTRRRAVDEYISGKSNNRDAAIMQLAMEFASVGVPYPPRQKPNLKRGESYYSGIGGNVAHNSPDAVGTALDADRAKSVAGPRSYTITTASAKDSPQVRQARNGGVFDGPNSGYPMELHGPEAVVPLPDGKNIPVALTGEMSSSLAGLNDKMSRMIYLLERALTVQGRTLQAVRN